MDDFEETTEEVWDDEIQPETHWYDDIGLSEVLFLFCCFLPLIFGDKASCSIHIDSRPTSQEKVQLEENLK